MIRSAKIFGLAVVAVLAMSAVAASAASAQLGKITSDGPVTLKGTETGVGQNKLTAFGSTVECPGSTYTGHKKNTVSTLLASGESEVTIRPTYVNCNFPVAMNGCHYLFRDATTAGAAGTYSVVADIVCPAGKEIEITGTFGCKVKVPAQTGKTGAHLTSTATDIDLTGAFTNVTATNCFGQHTTTATLHVDVTITGVNAEGKATSVSISD
jgi:hypothetical protein